MPSRTRWRGNAALAAGLPSGVIPGCACNKARGNGREINCVADLRECSRHCRRSWPTALCSGSCPHAARRSRSGDSTGIGRDAFLHSSVGKRWMMAPSDRMACTWTEIMQMLVFRWPPVVHRILVEKGARQEPYRFCRFPCAWSGWWTRTPGGWEHGPPASTSWWCLRSVSAGRWTDEIACCWDLEREWSRSRVNEVSLGLRHWPRQLSARGALSPKGQ